MVAVETLRTYESGSEAGLENFGWRCILSKFRKGEMFGRSSRNPLLGRIRSDNCEMDRAVTAQPVTGDFSGDVNASSRNSNLGFVGTVKGYAHWLEERFWDETSRLRKWVNLNRPRSLTDCLNLLFLNLFAMVVAGATGIFTFESSENDLRGSMITTIVFPLYLPHAVALTVACKYDRPVYLGNLLGLYVTRIYSAWRGDYLTSSARAIVLLAASAVGSAEVSTSAFFLKRLLCRENPKKSPTIESIRDAVQFLATVFLSTFFFDTVIALVICTSNFVKWSNFLRYWASSWMGVLAAMLTVVPCLLHFLVWVPRQSFFHPRKLVEAIGLTCVASALVVIMFITNVQAVIRPLPYLLFPIIILSAFRFNRLGCSVLVMLTSYVCTWASIRGRGAVYKMAGSPVPYSSPKLILQVELFVCVLGLVGILLAAAVREKKRLARVLAKMNEVLETTVNQRTQALVMANEELKESQRKAEEASQAKSDFLANMSHEIRTPIHGIMGLTALLLDSELTPDQRDSLSSVKECADLLLHIINSILDLAKIEAGRVEVEYVPFNVRTLVSNTVRMLTTRAQDRHLDLRWEVDSAVPEWMVGDSGKIQQCVLNLVGNAVKFTHEGSVMVHVSAASARQSLVWKAEDRENLLPVIATVEEGPKRDSATINVIPVEWGSDESSDEREFSAPVRRIVGIPVTFEVRDTGIGISSSKLRDIFTPFTQADASTSRVYGGTGLGLCIVQRFVELLGGKLRAESELGKGSAFKFSVLLSPSKDPSEDLNGIAYDNLYGPKGAKSDSRKIESGVFASGGDNKLKLDRSGGFHVPPHKQRVGDKEATILEVPATEVDQNPVHIDDLEKQHPSEGYGDFVDEGHTDRPTDHEVSIPANLQGEDWNPDLAPPDASQRRRSKQSWESVLRSWSGGVKESGIKGPEGQPASKGFEAVDHSRSRTSERPIPEPLLNSSNRNSGDTDHPPNQRSLPPQQPDILSAQADKHPFFSRESSLECNITVQSNDRINRLQDQQTNDSIEGVDDRSTGVHSYRDNKGLTREQSSSYVVDRGSLQTPTQRQQQPSSGGEAAVHRTDPDQGDAADDEWQKKRLHVLLAEDNLINQKIAVRQLQKHQHIVTVVGDGAAALKSAVSNHDSFDLVLMDVQMPIMDGLEATRRIRDEEAQRGWKRLPILGLTAHAIQGYDEICLSSGMDGYLGKPFDMNQLLQVMDKHRSR